MNKDALERAHERARAPSPPRGGWRQAVDHLPEAIVAVGADQRVAYINQASELLLGVTADEVVGRPVSVLLASEHRTVRGQSLFTYLITRGRDLDGRAVSARVVRKGGVEVEVELIVWLATDDGGNPLVLGLLRRRRETVDFDIEPLESAATSPAESERTYRLVFDNAPLGIFHWDARGIITACNDRFVRIVGSTKRVLIGLSMLTLPDRVVVACVEDALVGRRAKFEGDYRSATADKVTPIRADFNPIFASDGRVAGGVGIVEDVSERKLAERALAHADRMASLGTLAAGVAHEINNPLSFVSANLELALRRLASTASSDPDHARALREETRRALEEAQGGIARVQNLVRDLKTFARTDDDSRQQVDVRRCLETSIEISGAEIRRRAPLLRDFREVRAVLGSESRLVQVFVNLLVNAAQSLDPARPRGHRLTVRTRMSADDQTVIVEIEDTGAGIDPALQSRIFEPFYSTKPEGTGLGLSICHGIVAALGGNIEVRSQPGEGSTFSVHLPAAGDGRTVATSERTRVATNAADAPSRREATRTRARILVVDDERRLAETFRLALTDEYDVSVVHSGQAALAAVLGEPPFDVVLCDVMLPDLPGPQLYECVRAERPEALSRFVFMTGGAYTDAARNFLQRIDNPRLEKPFLLAELERLLRELTRERSSRPEA